MHVTISRPTHSHSHSRMMHSAICGNVKQWQMKDHKRCIHNFAESIKLQQESKEVYVTI
jgi:hypothetical protein